MTSFEPRAQVGLAVLFFSPEFLQKVVTSSIWNILLNKSLDPIAQGELFTVVIISCWFVGNLREQPGTEPFLVVSFKGTPNRLRNSLVTTS